MPSYDFSCVKCNKVFEELVSLSNISKVRCPKCDSKVEKLINACAFKSSKPQESSKWDNFGYRAGHNYEEAEAIRRNAEAKSHMGTEPYNAIDDLNTDSTWI